MSFMMLGAGGTDRALSIPVSPTTWNPSDAGGPISLTNGNLTMTQTTGGTGVGARSTNALSSGKAYFETTVNNLVGVEVNCGIARINQTITSLIATPTGEGWYIKFVGGTIFPSGGSTGNILNGHVCCVAVDIPNKLIWFRPDGGNWNGSGTANPATGAGGIDFSGVSASSWYAFNSMGNGTEQFTTNFGATSFAQSVPSGFSSWDVVAGV